MDMKNVNLSQCVLTTVIGVYDPRFSDQQSTSGEADDEQQTTGTTDTTGTATDTTTDSSKEQASRELSTISEMVDIRELSTIQEQPSLNSTVDVGELSAIKEHQQPSLNETVDVQELSTINEQELHSLNVTTDVKKYNVINDEHQTSLNATGDVKDSSRDITNLSWTEYIDQPSIYSDMSGASRLVDYSNSSASDTENKQHTDMYVPPVPPSDSPTVTTFKAARSLSFKTNGTTVDDGKTDEHLHTRQACIPPAPKSPLETQMYVPPTPPRPEESHMYVPPTPPRPEDTNKSTTPASQRETYTPPAQTATKNNNPFTERMQRLSIKSEQEVTSTPRFHRSWSDTVNSSRQFTRQISNASWVSSKSELSRMSSTGSLSDREQMDYKDMLTGYDVELDECFEPRSPTNNLTNLLLKEEQRKTGNEFNRSASINGGSTNDVRTTITRNDVSINNNDEKTAVVGDNRVTLSEQSRNSTPASPVLDLSLCVATSQCTLSSGDKVIITQVESPSNIKVNFKNQSLPKLEVILRL